jgi:hypothetical protein
MTEDKSEMMGLEFRRYPAAEMRIRAEDFKADMSRRRSVRWGICHL